MKRPSSTRTHSPGPIFSVTGSVDWVVEQSVRSPSKSLKLPCPVRDRAARISPVADPLHASQWLPWKRPTRRTGSPSQAMPFVLSHGGSSTQVNRDEALFPERGRHPTVGHDHVLRAMVTAAPNLHADRRV